MESCGPISFAAAQAYMLQPAERVVEKTSAHQLVAGSVPGRVSFDGVELPNVQPLQLYSRSADRIEAATRIATGQRLNIQA